MMSYAEIKFSVVIPTYNNALTLARAIDSVLRQSFPAHEIIVIDDGSCDETHSVISGYSDKISYIYQENSGVSAARNVGARVATGDWLAFLDADDTFMTNRLEAHANWIAREPGIDFLLADQEFRRPEGDLLQYAISGCSAGRALIARHPDQIEIPLEQSDFESLVADGFAEIRTLSVPRLQFLALGGFPLNRKIGEDLYFFVRLLMASSRGGVTNLPLAVYYIYPSSALRKDPVAAQLEFVRMLESLVAETPLSSGGIRMGLDAKLRQARLSLVYLYLRKGRRHDALAVTFTALLRKPSLTALRDLASVLRGLPG